MALSPFGRGRGGETTGEAPASASASIPVPQAGLTAFIDQGSEFEGKLSFKDKVRIDGRFVGEITSENTLIVGETGEIQASIRSKSVVVSGNVVGDIKASERLILHKSGCVEGDVETPCLVMEAGAVLNGRVTMKQDRKSGAAGVAPLKALETAAGK